MFCYICEYKHLLTFRFLRYVVIATKLAHRLQIRSILHNDRAAPTIPPSYIRVRTVVWECGEGQIGRQTHRQTDARDRYTFRLGYASLKCNNKYCNLICKS